MKTRLTLNIVVAVIFCLVAGFLILSCDNAGGGEKAWSTSIDTIGAVGTCSHPRAFFYEAKKANVIWASNGTSALYSNHFNGTEWGGAVSQASYEDTFAIMPEIFSNMTGVSFVIWVNDFGEILTAKIDGNEWGSPENMTNFDESFDGPQDIACKLGSEIIAFAVWKETPSGNIQAARYEEGSGWSDSAQISGGGSNFYTKVAVDEDGNAIAVLIDSDYELEAIRYSDSSWGEPTFLGSAQDDIESFNIAIGLGGVAMAVWRQGANGIDIYACYFDGSSWSTEIDISSATGDTPEVAFDPDGNAIVVWTESNSIYSRRFLSTDTWPTWSEDKRILAGPTTGMGECQIASDPDGNVFIVWDNAGEIHAKRYEAGTDWAAWAASGEVTVLDDNGGCSEPYIAVDMNGRAIVVWTRGDNIYSKRYFE